MQQEVKQQCYPCSVHGHSCVLEESWQPKPQRARRALVPVLPYSNVDCEAPWFEVALWLWREYQSFPEYVSYVEAVHAFAAVEQMMRFYRLRTVAVASVRPLHGSLVYRAYGVRLSLIGGRIAVERKRTIERCRK